MALFKITVKVVLVLALMFSLPGIGRAETMLKEAGFEEKFVAWQTRGNASSIGKYSWRFHEGSSAFGVGNDKGINGAWGEAFQDIPISSPANSGDIFIFRMWVHSEPNYSGTAAIKLEFLDSQGQPINTYQGDILKGAFDWKKEVVSGHIPEGAKTARVICHSEGMSPGNGLSFIWFDDGSAEIVSIKASSSLDQESGPENVIVGKGVWRSAPSDEQWLEADYNEGHKIAGLSIEWGKDYPQSYEVAIKENGKEWRTVYSESDCKGGKEDVFLADTQITSVKVSCKKSSTGNGYEIKRIEMVNPEERLNKKEYFKKAAKDFPAYYPRWMTNQEAYWTIVGNPADDKKSLLCEDGTIEPFKKNFCIMPFLFLDGKIITRDDAVITQRLEKGYLPLPSVDWNVKGFNMNLRLFTYGQPKKTITYAWYTVSNNDKKDITGKLFLAIRPFMVYPPWQGGVDGFSPINAVKYKDSTVLINDKYRIVSLVKPDNFGTDNGEFNFPVKFPSASFKGDIVSYIRNGNLPEARDADDREGFVSSALEYNFDLKPGASQNFFIAIPIYETMPDMNDEMDIRQVGERFDKMISENIAYWESKTNKVEIDIPEKDITATLKSNIAYSLITKDGPGFQPGSWSYDKTWMRDGSISCSSLMEMGLLDEAKEFIDWYVGYQYKNGEVPPIIDTKATNPLWEEQEKGLIEYDSQGEFIWIILQYYHFSRDKEWLEAKLPNVMKALDYLTYLRSQTLSPEFSVESSDKRKFYGILPRSQSHEGYWREYSYWDDLWALKGWKDAATIVGILGREDLKDRVSKGYSDLKKSFYDSMDLTIKWKNLDYIPASASLADFDPTSTAVAATYCDEYRNFPQENLKRTFDRYYNELKARFSPNAEYRFTPYEMRTVPAFLYMGYKERALEMLRFMLKCRRPLAWNHFAEVVHSDYRFPTYIGDMPHTWVGAEYINAVRSLFAYESDDRLILGHGIDEAWLSGEKGISVKNMPTYYGNINYSVKKGNGILTIKVWGKGTTTPPNGFIFKSPLAEGIKEVRLNGKTLKEFSGNEVVFSSLPAEISIYFSKSP